jgi:hypothetical protein
MNEPPHLFDFFLVNVEERIEPFHLAGDAAGKSGGVKLGDAADAVLALDDGLPGFFRANSQGGDEADPCNYDSARNTAGSLRKQIPRSRLLLR